MFCFNNKKNKTTLKMSLAARKENFSYKSSDKKFQKFELLLYNYLTVKYKHAQFLYRNCMNLKMYPIE